MFTYFMLMILYFFFIYLYFFLNKKKKMVAILSFAFGFIAICGICGICQMNSWTDFFMVLVWIANYNFYFTHGLTINVCLMLVMIIRLVFFSY